MAEATPEMEFHASLSQQFAAVADGDSATGNAKPEGPYNTSDAESDSPEVEVDGEAEGQPAGKSEPDPWAELKTKHTPESILAALKEAERAREVDENARAMRREASQRNEAASRDRQMLEDLKRKADTALETTNSILNTAAMLAQEGNEELALQTLRLAGKQAASVADSQQGRAPLRGVAPNAEVEAIKAELAALKEQHNQVTFGMNHRDVQQSVMQVAANHPLLKDPEMQKLGIYDRVVREAVATVYEKDKALRERGEPGINPWAPGVIAREAAAAFAEAVKPWDEFSRRSVNKWREERKAKNAQAPPASKGATAGVRAAPNLKQSLPQGSTYEDFHQDLKNKFIQASEPSRPA